MIQLQNTRFILNWKKGDDKYPSYDTLLPEFNGLYDKFTKFVNNNSLGSIEHNQWEITYVNHILKDVLWNDITDITKVFPWISPPATKILNQIPDDYSCKWSLIIDENLGRLHVEVKHVRLFSKDGPEALYRT